MRGIRRMAESPAVRAEWGDLGGRRPGGLPAELPNTRAPAWSAGAGSRRCGATWLLGRHRCSALGTVNTMRSARRMSMARSAVSRSAPCSCRSCFTDGRTAAPLAFGGRRRLVVPRGCAAHRIRFRDLQPWEPAVPLAMVDVSALPQPSGSGNGRRATWRSGSGHALVRRLQQGGDDGGHKGTAGKATCSSPGSPPVRWS